MFGHAAARTALPQPPKTTQNVPSISAPALQRKDMKTLLSGTRQGKLPRLSCHGKHDKRTRRTLVRSDATDRAEGSDQAQPRSAAGQHHVNSKRFDHIAGRREAPRLTGDSPLPVAQAIAE
jgi:hypothetical protein